MCSCPSYRQSQGVNRDVEEGKVIFPSVKDTVLIRCEGHPNSDFSNVVIKFPQPTFKDGILDITSLSKVIFKTEDPLLKELSPLQQKLLQLQDTIWKDFNKPHALAELVETAAEGEVSKGPPKKLDMMQVALEILLPTDQKWQGMGRQAWLHSTAVVV